MTRRVRSGNTQKHKKMPGEATKWGEFDLQKPNKSFPEKQEKIESKSDFDKINVSPCVSDSSKDKNIDLTKSTGNPPIKIRICLKKKKSVQSENCVAHNDSEVPQNTDSTHESPFIAPNKCIDEIVSLDSTAEISSKTHPVYHEMDKEISEENDSHLKDNQDNITNKREKKKERYLKKLQNKRAKNGITLLSAQAERKLYRIKKKLRKKGVSPEILKEVIRKERRKEELKFRKTNDPSKLCFHCRQPGHFLANCPQKLGSSNQETGICFKCGNDRHTSLKCPKKIQGFPFAKCFICKEQGHISKDCPRNERGVYPKGGKCNLCGNINHLRKDCPSLRKKAKTEETIITLNTIEKETSVDDDEVVVKSKNRKESVKKPKLVKF